MSYITSIQKQLFNLKNKADNLKLLKHQLTGFNSSSEYEAVHTMLSITEMQIAAGIRSLEK